MLHVWALGAARGWGLWMEELQPGGGRPLKRTSLCSVFLRAVLWIGQFSFPGGSVVKNPPANAGDVGLISGSGRSPRVGNGYPLQYSCLGNSLDRGAWCVPAHGSQRVGQDQATNTEKEMATHSSVFAWRIPGAGEPGGLPSMGSHRVGHDWNDLAAAGQLTLSLTLIADSLCCIAETNITLCSNCMLIIC